MPAMCTQKQRVVLPTASSREVLLQLRASATRDTHQTGAWVTIRSITSGGGRVFQNLERASLSHLSAEPLRLLPTALCSQQPRLISGPARTHPAVHTQSMSHGPRLPALLPICSFAVLRVLPFTTAQARLSTTQDFLTVKAFTMQFLPRTLQVNQVIRVREHMRTLLLLAP